MSVLDRGKTMHHTQRYCKGFFSLLIALLWAAVSVMPSFADIAPPPPAEGFTIFPGSETTQVRMTYEHVFMNIDLDGVAKVDANFVMRNLGNKEESMEVRFPLYSSEKYRRVIPNVDVETSFPDLQSRIWPFGYGTAATCKNGG